MTKLMKVACKNCNCPMSVLGEVEIMTPNQYEDEVKNVTTDLISAQASALRIVDESSAKNGLSMALQARKIKNSMEESRKKILRPVLDYQSAINEVVKGVQKTIDEIEGRLQEKVEAWIKKENEDPFNQIDEMSVEDGVIYVKQRKEYEVIDQDLIPREYLSLNEKKLKEAILECRRIPGLKICEKQEFQMRVKN